MKRVEPKNLNAGAPISPVTVHLDRLAQEVIREGWKAVPRYDGPFPLLRVFGPAVPDFGESITSVPGTTPDIWLYRSSTGEDLAPHTEPVRAAERITRILTPYVTAALAAQTHQRGTTGAPRLTPPPDSARPFATEITESQERSGVLCWWGACTGQWWALIPGGTQQEIINASDPEALLGDRTPRVRRRARGPAHRFCFGVVRTMVTTAINGGMGRMSKRAGVSPEVALAKVSYCATECLYPAAPRELRFSRRTTREDPAWGGRSAV
ncbi:hypothetical protein [Actinomadura formosensis]|uniref:hypothetical protein n=1 Tax=Actinomadura formosensis TaxID=60706 RepID=UPI0008365CF7|nr:hypothetical protein [Actinomadura formosensis]